MLDFECVLHQVSLIQLVPQAKCAGCALLRVSELARGKASWGISFPLFPTEEAHESKQE